MIVWTAKTIIGLCFLGLLSLVMIGFYVAERITEYRNRQKKN